MSDIVTGDFNYGSVDEDTAEKLEYFAKSGKALIRKSQIQFIADMGKLLSEAREVMANHGDGKFIKWATAEFDIAARTIYNYCNAWDKCLCNGCTNYLNWSATAVYLASSEDLPKPVQKKLAAMASKDMVRESDVKRVIKANKPKPEPAAPSRESLEFTADLDSDGDPVCSTPVEDDDTPEPVQVTPASIMLDSLGRQIPINLRSASELVIQLVATGRELDKFRKAAKDFAEQPGGDWLRVQDISDGIKVLKDHFQQAAYHTACVKCGGKGCKVCEMTGWIPDYLKGTL
jgi:hypothetical protein